MVRCIFLRYRCGRNGVRDLELITMQPSAVSDEDQPLSDCDSSVPAACSPSLAPQKEPKWDLYVVWADSEVQRLKGKEHHHLKGTGKV